ncbi:hypothetical protein BC936DRAFT_137208 [Jimgerdemannia flammicorona]|uniref:Uncharacterized protein n=2 Tax=Jimgerdemannia flammicorona TaxID=994334 RepID=A0A433QEL3_9FUNG|nr:hypothetical protein BC936DRAFT_137208 [Jimgerdemannia flammicorona]RUS28071.1 hypothetical protein BC938DRAFT_482375 [Jimgerdemannia flammicorona]
MYKDYETKQNGNANINLKIHCPFSRVTRTQNITNSSPPYSDARVSFANETGAVSVIGLATITGETADTFLDVVEDNLPSGMMMSC